MKQIFTFLFLICTLKSFSQEFEALNIELLGWNKSDTFNVFNDTIVGFSSCWGWDDGKGNEYAIVGTSEGTLIFEVTDPKNIVLRDHIQGFRSESIWREYKTYKNYLYCVSDDGNTNRFDIVDLSYLPDSVHIVHSGSDIISTGHTIFVEQDYLYIGLLNHVSMAVFDLKENPESPKLLRILNNDYPELDVHDMYVRNDTIYASCGFDGLHIFEFDNEKFIEIGSLKDYEFSGYNHSSILTPDGKTLIMLDEVPKKLPAKSVDVSDVSSPKIISTFFSQNGNATPHNPFLAAPNTFVMSSYEDGIQVFDYSDPKNIRQTGYFDTHYQSNFTTNDGGYKGAWSAYTKLPSKNLIVVDMQNGLFILDPKEAYRLAVLGNGQDIKKEHLVMYPTISKSEVHVFLPKESINKGKISSFDQNGRTIWSKNIGNFEELKINVSNWFPGTYHLVLQLENNIQYSNMVVVP